MGKRPARVPGVRICESYLLAYIRELKRATAEQWLQMDDDIKHLQALNQSLAKQALAAVEPETKPTPTTQKQSQVRGGQWPTTPHRG
jgi:uncharacterized coiled-coil protein SlyX